MTAGSLIVAGLDDVSCAGVLAAAIGSHNWMRRRVESVEFLQDSTMRRRVSVDVVVPKTAPVVDGAEGSAVRLIPIGLLAKRPLVAFDASDASGVSLPVLSTKENGHLTGIALGWMAESVPTPVPLDATTKPLLYRLANDPAVKAQEHLKALLDGPDGQLVQDRIGPWLQRFTDGFLLIAAVPVDSPINQVIKFCYEQRYEVTGSSDGVKAEDSRAEAFRKRWVHRLSRIMGVRASSVELDLPAASMCHSYHFEAVVPEDVEVPSARLVDRTDDAVRVLRVSTALEQFARRQHLYCDLPSSVDRPAVRMLLRPAASGWWLRCGLAAMLVTLTLAVSAWRFDAATSDGSNSDLAALVVVVVGLSATALARPGAHELAVRLTPGVRLVALAASGLPYLGALTMAFGGESLVVGPILWLLTAVGALLAAALLVPFGLVRQSARA